jgi:hypothetical protein
MDVLKNVLLTGKSIEQTDFTLFAALKMFSSKYGLHEKKVLGPETDRDQRGSVLGLNKSSK